MCRYAMTSYKSHEACFDCRKTFKRRLLHDMDRDETESVPAKCPDCGQLTADMGLDFKSPPRTDVKSWAHLRTLYRVGITFHSCGCGGPGYVPANNEELQAQLSKYKQLYVRNLRHWLNNDEPAPKGKRAIERQQTIAHWTARIQEVDQQLALV